MLRTPGLLTVAANVNLINTSCNVEMALTAVYAPNAAVGNFTCTISLTVDTTIKFSYF